MTAPAFPVPKFPLLPSSIKDAELRRWTENLTRELDNAFKHIQLFTPTIDLSGSFDFQVVAAGFTIDPGSLIVGISAASALSSDTVTVIKAGRPWQLLIIRKIGGGNIITLKAGGNLQLAGGVDYAMTNLDTLTVFYDDIRLVWTELARSVN